MNKILYSFMAIFITSLNSISYALNENLSITAKADIPTILELKIEQSENSELRFGNIQPLASEAAATGPVVVIVQVTSNIGETYQVTQAMNTELQNGDGQVIDSRNLKFTSEGTKTNGIAVESLTSVTKSPQTIFISDAKGTSDAIKAQYFLTVPPSQPAGDYSALLTYTVSAA